MREIIISDPGNVYVDGVNVGAAMDAIANRPELAPDLQRALKSTFDGMISSQAEQLSTYAERATAAEKERDEALSALAAKTVELAAADAKPALKN